MRLSQSPPRPEEGDTIIGKRRHQPTCASTSRPGPSRGCTPRVRDTTSPRMQSPRGARGAPRWNQTRQPLREFPGGTRVQCGREFPGGTRASQEFPGGTRDSPDRGRRTPLYKQRWYLPPRSTELPMVRFGGLGSRILLEAEGVSRDEEPSPEAENQSGYSACRVGGTGTMLPWMQVTKGGQGRPEVESDRVTAA